MKSLEDFLFEKFKIKVNAKGVKRRKKDCPKGQKADGNRCVKIKSSEKISRKKGLKKAKRSKKAGGASLKRKQQRLTKKAMKKRKSRGL
ncbi:MAG: hypothetical protein KAS32_24155 [Candidatus Peribacteraceae bacterium]|nr:hypothetical protein [Candidatus Peribacteraceae bacterium]